MTQEDHTGRPHRETFREAAAERLEKSADP
jgi:hypothetical protein